MREYQDAPTQAMPESTMGSLIAGISSSRERIQEHGSRIMVQMERMGFAKPGPSTMGSAQLSKGDVPRERTALEVLECQANCLRDEADRLETIAYLLTNQF